MKILSERSRRGLIFRPISLLYFGFLLFWLLLILPLAVLFLRSLLVQGLGIPPEMVGAFLLLSLLGSFVNVPVWELRSRAPMFNYREISFFGVTWLVPRFDIGVQRTIVSVNVGGALVPLIVSIYILAWAIPHSAYDLLSSYGKALFVFTVVSIVVNRTSRLVRGFGIGTPTFVPPSVTALATILVYSIGAPCNPTQIAYVGGTLGTLVGADLMNLGKIPQLGAPVVSIGGAGTFDGIYTTGLISVLLVLLLI